MSDNLKMFESGLPEWVIAESETEAQEIYTQYWLELDGGLSEDELKEEWRECKIEEKFTYRADVYNPSDADETKTIREWIAERGKGYFATSER